MVHRRIWIGTRPVIACLSAALTLVAAPVFADTYHDTSQTDGFVQTTVEDIRAQVTAQMNLPDSKLAHVELTPLEGARTEVQIEVDGETLTVEVWPHSVRSANFQVFHHRPDGTLEQVDPGPVRTVRGVVRGETDSSVVGSIIDGRLVARIRIGDVSHTIESLDDYHDGPATGASFIYDDADVNPEGACGTNHRALGGQAAAEQNGDLPVNTQAIGGGLSYAELACDADFDYFDRWGVNTLARVENVINRVNTTYESDVDISHAIVILIIRETQVYTSNGANTLLSQFRSRWLQFHGNIPRDVTHLFTGRSISGSTIGIAWTIGGICTSSAFCLSQSDFSSNFACVADLTVHELGHLWNGSHCSCPSNTMNPSITCAESFSTATRNSIISHRNSRNCLSDTPPGFCDASSNNSSFESISRVQLNTIDNSSGSSGYADFLSQSTTLNQAVDYPITVNIAGGFATDIGGVWIDWNQDEDFDDAGEQIPTSWSGTGPYNGTISVPLTADLGETRMRIRLQDADFDAALSSCGDTDYGEVEDYTVIIDGPPAPSNDLCEDAITISIGASTDFTNLYATSGGEDVFCAPSDTEIDADVWFKFTASCDGTAFVNLCASTYDTKVAIYEFCPNGNEPNIACNDDVCGDQSRTSWFTLAGQEYLIRVGGFNDAQGDGSLLVTLECFELTGACCFVDGSCSVDTPANCAGGAGVYQGDNVTCNPCPQPPATGACCIADGSCSVETSSDCASSGGGYQGDDTVCNPCPQPNPCPADVDGNGEVAFLDLLEVLGSYDSNCDGCPADVNGDGLVGFLDVVDILSAWGDCP